MAQENYLLLRHGEYEIRGILKLSIDRMEVNSVDGKILNADSSNIVTFIQRPSEIFFTSLGNFFKTRNFTQTHTHTYTYIIIGCFLLLK